jgi:predicted O-methyltransferase YrrM
MKMKTLAKTILKNLPVFAKIIQERDKYILGYPPGHFYSPIPSLDEIKLKEQEIFDFVPRELPGLNLNEAEQLQLFNIFIELYREIPFEDYKKDSLRYGFKNGFYTYSDAIILYCMIRYLKPKRIIEVGSGYSSCVMLDTNELDFDNSISCTFIEPYPQNLLSLIKESDQDKVEIIEQKLQDVEQDKFLDLSAGDILFIDSTHVSKVNSDVNYIFSKILPNLQSGVYIHFHDIFYPFEYPKKWIYQGISWNEAYMLKTFLQYNTAFKIVFFNTFLEYFHEDKFLKYMPLCMKNKGGSIWLQKT